MPQSLRPDSMKSYMGYAVCDKAQNSRELKVYCPELLPFISGDLSATEVSNDIRTTGRSGTRQSQIKSANFITCIYRDEDTNRTFPPDVRAGEEVVVYTYGDNNVFYWKSAGRNDNNRRTETYRIGISGTLDNKASISDDNSYFFEMDTRRGHHIKLSTSNTDGEKHRYLFLIDSDASTIDLADEAGNMFHIDSEIPRVCMKNSENALIDLNGQNIAIACKKDITIISESGNINIDARGGTYTQHSKGNMTLRTDAVMTHQSTGNMNLQTNANQSTQVAGDSTTTVTGSYRVSAGGIVSLTSGGNMSLTAGGGLSISFHGSGTCRGNGGTLSMYLGRFNVNRG